MKILSRMIYLRILIFIFLSLGSTAFAGVQEEKYPIIPYPTQLTQGVGSFTVTPATVIISPDVFQKEARMLGELFKNSFGKCLEQKSGKQKQAIQLKQDASIKMEEGYRMEITKNGILISAKARAGMFRAIQTVRQLLPAVIESKNNPAQKSLSLPAVRIEDQPAYDWRGMHLDVSRHFFTVDYVKKMLDLMALYKFNKFHWHLTDDQGWRIEIKKYPLLTEKGAWRTFNNQDSTCMELSKENPDFIIDPRFIVQKDGKTMYGGFYTQDEIRDIIAYADERHIEVIPEIDMPGHMMAAIDAYNYLSCSGESAFGEVFSIPICPCLETTYEFAENVFSEVAELFPSKYIHIGGDEVERSWWEKSPACKELMEREGLKSSAELQSYFIHRMEDFFKSKGKELIGWDEILEGGISPSALIMYWRTWVPKAPVMAAKNGNKVIMTPGEPLYFDAYPDRTSLSRVYHFNPIPAALNDSEAKAILGAQANIWTETILSENSAEYMMMPRMTALSEVVWTGKKDYTSFLKRLNSHYKRLDILDVNYRLPDLEGLLDSYAFTDSATLWVEKPLPGLTIRYAEGGALPDAHSKELFAPLGIHQSKKFKIAAFKPNGARGDVYDVNFSKQQMAAPVSGGSDAGLKATWYKRFFKNVGAMTGASVSGDAVVSQVAVPTELKAESFGVHFRGFIEVPETGIYTFYLGSDDGSVLRIAGRVVVDNDGLHPYKEKNGQVALQKGAHPFELDFIEGGGGYRLTLQYSVNGSEPKDIPGEWLKH